MRNIIEVVLPFFAIIGLGYVATRRGAIRAADVEGLTRFVFWFPLPVLLFRGIAGRNLAEMAELALFFAYAASTLLTFFLFRALFRRLFPLGKEETIFHGFGTAQGNNGFLAIPLMPALFGEQAMAPLALTLFADMLVLYPLVFVLADLASKERHGPLELARSIARTFYTNPFLISMLLGLAVAASGWVMPVPLASLVDTLAQAGPPVALFVLGASLAIHRARSDHVDEIAIMNVAKLIAHPAIFFAIAAFVIPLPPLHFAVGVAVAALPTGINLYMFSQRYVDEPAIYSAAILSSTALSVGSFSIVVWMLTR